MKQFELYSKQLCLQWQTHVHNLLQKVENAQQSICFYYEWLLIVKHKEANEGVKYFA